MPSSDNSIMYGPPFLVKKACHRARVLDEADCPPCETPYNIIDYPRFYDAIYYPELYPNNFINPFTVSRWLELSMCDHVDSCHACSQILGLQGLSCSIEYVYEIGFIALFEGYKVVTCQAVALLVSHRIVLEVDYLSSPSYTHCINSLAARTASSIVSTYSSPNLAEYESHSALATNVVDSMLDVLPYWLLGLGPEFRVKLDSLPKSDVAECFLRLSNEKLPNTKIAIISFILQHFLANRDRFILMRENASAENPESWCAFQKRQHHDYVQFQKPGFSLSVNTYFSRLYGAVVYKCLRVAPRNLVAVYETPAGFVSPSLSWLMSPIDLVSKNVRALKKSAEFMILVKNIPSLTRPPFCKSYSKTLSLVIDHIRRRALYLCRLSPSAVCFLALSVAPEFSSPVDMTPESAIVSILNAEFGTEILNLISSSCVEPSRVAALDVKKANQKQKRRDQKISKALEYEHNITVEEEAWPVIPSSETVFDCLYKYREGTAWVEPLVCGCCAQMSKHTFEVTVVDRNECYPPTSFLGPKKPGRVALDLLILDNLVFQSDFVFDCPPIDGLMLCSRGIVSKTGASAVILFCNDCLSSLCRHKIPRFALANKLYRGVLPDEFSDLTWVEEMVCAIHRNTAHVTRLYGSSDPAQPTVLHGNTCAHEMNVVSTAQVLPRTPSDVNDMISVVFVGTKRPTLKALSNIFRVRKKKILLFLQWLGSNNVLYANIPIDNLVVDAYPEDGVLPGLDERIVHDTESNPENLFEEETAGISEHPATALTKCSDAEDGEQSSLIEYMGVTDPEAVQIPGRTFTAFALRNLSASLSGESNAPIADLIIRRSNKLVPEYNNPSLIPGMFPTLFPYGVGGFEDNSRSIPISLQQQAQYYLNIHDRTFLSSSSVTQVQQDVMDEFHRTTLGPYSFHLFVSAVITHTTLKTKEVREHFIRGRRSKVNPRPSAKRIKYTLQRMMKRKRGNGDTFSRGPGKKRKLTKV